MNFNRLYAIGRRSELAYVRFYPNPGFMIPWARGRRFVWSWHKGHIIRRVGTRSQPARKT
jgi:hypothetical protein